MWVALLVTFGVAVLSGLGVGSAGLLVVYLTFVEHVPQFTAQGVNLLFFLFSSGSALLFHLSRTPLLFGCILLLLPGGMVGCLLGARLAAALPGALLRRFFGILLIFSGSVGLFRKGEAQNKGKKPKIL